MGDEKKKKGLLGLSRNVVWMGVVSLLNDLSSDMIFPFIPIFLTSVLGASLTFVGLVEGIADATASLMKVPAGWLSDQWGRRKGLVVAGYSLSAVAKPILAAATAPWHVLAVRFLDRAGKGTREAPRDALLSFSVPRTILGRAFGFHRGMDTAGAALGPLAAFVILPFVDNDYRVLFLLSFVASFFAVLILATFVREVKPPKESTVPITQLPARQAGGPNYSITQSRIRIPFFLFLAVATVASLGRASEAFFILKAKDVGVAIALLPIIYFVYNASLALLATPVGAIADRLGKRNMYLLGLMVFAATYAGFAYGANAKTVWLLFILYAIYAAMTEGVGRAIVSGLIDAPRRGTALGIYHAVTGIALLPASLVFGYLNQHFGSSLAFTYGGALALAAAVLFLGMKKFIYR